MGIGNTMILRSTNTLIRLVANTEVTSEPHTPGSVKFHVFEKGRQLRKVKRTTPTPKADTVPITMKVTRRKVRLG